MALHSSPLPSGDWYQPQACRLADGRVLMALNTAAAVGEVVGNAITWTPLAALAGAPSRLVALADGRALSVTAGVMRFISLDGTTISTVDAGAQPTTVNALVLLADGRIMAINGGTKAVWFGSISGDTISWAAATALPAYHYDLPYGVGIMGDGRIVIAGGWSGATTAVWFGTISGNTIAWVSGTALPSAVFGGYSCSFAAGKVVVSGGSANSAYQIVGSVTGNTVSWATTTNAITGGRRNHAAVTTAGGRLIILGGQYYSGSWLTATDALVDDTSGVIASGSLVLPIVISVDQLVNCALPLRIVVLPSTMLLGAESVCYRTDRAAVWTAIVRIDGAVVDSVISDIVIEAEESSARIADITLVPDAGSTIYLPGWTGKVLTIEVADNSTGVALDAYPLFSGVIDTPGVDVTSGTLSIRATDDLQGRCLGMSQAAIAALIADSRFSPAVFDAAADGWSHAQDRLSTLPAALDISPLGALRLTPWAAKSTPDLTLGESVILDGSLSVSLAERSTLTNEVNVTFGYRFPRVKAEGFSVNHEAVDMTGFAAYILAGNSFMQRAAVEAAIEAAGATIIDVVYTPLPDEIIAVGAGFFTPSAADAELCMGFTATVSFDYAATTEEQHEIRVYAQKSIDAIGVRRESMSGALEGEYPDLVATEAGIQRYRAEETAIPPADMATVVIGKTNAAEVTLSPETDRTAANAAMETLIAIAKTRIWQSHRGNTVSATVPLMPAIDLDKTIQIDTSRVDAKGKVRRVTHRLSPATGEATTEFSLALCSVAGVGIDHPETATTAPAGTSAAATDLLVAPTVTFNSRSTQDKAITINFPQVENAERNGAAITLPASYAATMVEDALTITL